MVQTSRRCNSRRCGQISSGLKSTSVLRRKRRGTSKEVICILADDFYRINSNGGCEGSCRHFGVALQALAGRVLSCRNTAVRDVSVLLKSFRYGRDQQQFLSPTHCDHLRQLAGVIAAKLLLRRQGQPLHHAHEEAEGSGKLVGEVFSRRRSIRPKTRSNSFSTSATMETKPRTTRRIPAHITR